MLISTKMQLLFSNKQQEISCLQPYNRSEADTRILIHLTFAAIQRHYIALVRTMDSDVVTLVVHWFASLGLSE
jgi:hypothetical protein